MHLKNPGGRIVAIDDTKQALEFLEKGFSKITPREEKAFIQSRYIMVQAMKDREKKPHSPKVYLATVTQSGGTDGYGVVSKNLIRELRALDVVVKTQDEDQKIGLLLHTPYSIMRMGNPYRIIFTMFESDKIPEDWAEYLLEADEVVVPSKWCQGVFKKAGVKSKVIPLGYDDGVYEYFQRRKRKIFTFVHYNAFNVRKGFLELFKAFTEEFTQDEKVKLVLKTTSNNIPSAMPINPRQYKNIEVITGKMNNSEMRELLNNSDCFVFPSRGEGFGLTPLEAMATGLPVIVPNAHGISEYFNSQYMYSVKVEGEVPATYSAYKNQDVGHMVKCSVKDLRKQMRYVFEHQREARSKGKMASEYVKRYTWTKTAERLNKLLMEYHIKPIIKRNLKNVLPLERVK